MKNIIISTLVFFVAIPFVSLAQKAYENIIYTGYLNGRKITFLLADGYIGASIITLQSSRVGKINFNPEFLSADKNGNLKFLHYLTQNKASKSYFVLFGISDDDIKIPKRVFGIYSAGKKQYKITLTK